MYTVEALAKRFETVFTAKQAQILADAITTSYRELVKTSDFNELKEIVRDIAEVQQRTEARMEELAQAQQRTEGAVAEMALLVTHYARPAVLQQAEDRGAIVVQSFGWWVDPNIAQIGDSTVWPDAPFFSGYQDAKNTAALSQGGGILKLD